MNDRDIIDDIDALVDEQMAGGEYGHRQRVREASRCPHCGDDWHGLAITEAMQRMRWAGRFEDGYRHAEDASAVVCPGSKFIGPWANADQLARTRAWKQAGIERLVQEDRGYSYQVGEFGRGQDVMVGWIDEAYAFEDTALAYDRFRRDAGRRGVRLLDANWAEASQPLDGNGESWQLPPNPMLGDDWRQPFRAEITPAGELERFTLDRPLAVGDRVRIDFGNGRHWTGKVAELRPDGLPRLAVDEPHVQETIQRFTDTVRRIAELVLPGVADSFRQIAETLRPLMQDLPYDVPDTRTPQERALPRPSTTPPMWAPDPTRTRRRRNR